MRLTELSAATFLDWLSRGVLTVEQIGQENCYAVDEFGHTYFAKLEG